MVEPTGKCWCGCGDDCERAFFVAGHDQGALYAALDRLGYGEHGAIARFLEAHDFQPGGKRSAELREAVAKKYESGKGGPVFSDDFRAGPTGPAFGLI